MVMFACCLFVVKFHDNGFNFSQKKRKKSISVVFFINIIIIEVINKKSKKLRLIWIVWIKDYQKNELIHTLNTKTMIFLYFRDHHFLYVKFEFEIKFVCHCLILRVFVKSSFLFWFLLFSVLLNQFHCTQMIRFDW